MRRFLNVNVLKLMLALGILFGIIGLVYYAHSRAEQELAQFAKEKKEDTSESTVVDNYELKEIAEDSSIHWLLTAKKGTMESSSKDVDLEDVKVNYYKEGKVNMVLSAPTGKANELTHIIVLHSNANTKVQVSGDEKQAQLVTKDLELTKNNQFTATGGVNINWPKVAKVTGNIARGSFVKGAIHNLVITGNTHALVDM